MTEKQKKIDEYDRMLQKHIANKDFVKIRTAVTDGESIISGFILKMSKKFLLIQKEEEFYLNGYAIIRKDHFDALRCNKYDRTFKRILKNEGISDTQYGIEEEITLSSWQAILGDLKRLDWHIIVECEDLKEPTFLIGPIKRVSKDTFSIQNYDPTGLLDKKSTVVKYEDVTIVKFGDRYINVFRKYLRDR